MVWDDGKYNLEGDNLRFHGGQLKKGIDRALKKSAVTVLERTMGIDLLTKNGVIAQARCQK